MSTELVRQAAALCDQGKYHEAIDLIEANISEFDEITRLLALLQAFYAAKQAGDEAKARALARLVAAEDPDVPSIQEYLT